MTPIFRTREDKLKPYLTSVAQEFMFTEVNPEFLSNLELDFMIGTPIPIAKKDFMKFTEKGLSTMEIADNMALVIGSDTHFRYAENYLKYLNRMFDSNLTMVLVGNGQDAMSQKEYRRGMAYLRAALLYRFESMQSMYCYATGCRFWYLSMEGEEESEELISILKAEAHLYFEYLTNDYPDFAKPWYFLGYDYLNAGQYTKAQLAWTHFVSKAVPEDDEDGCIPEIQERLASIEEPVKIEHGVNLLVAGRLEEGLAILEPYVDTPFNTWWPLHFYLASAYRELGHPLEAEEGFLKVLELSPSNEDAMIALSELYEEKGDQEKADKYKNKAALVRANKEEKNE